MCYNRDEVPPDPPRDGNAARGEEIVLTGADGTRFNAYFGRPGTPGPSQVLILPDVNGLAGFYKELALRLAQQGVTALAIDFYGHTAGAEPRDDKFNGWDHAPHMTPEAFFSDVRAGLDYLREGDGAARSTFVCGFCIGGSLTLLTGAQDFGLQGLIPFYASRMDKPVARWETPVLDEALNVKVPVLGFFGSADPVAPEELTHRLDEQLDKAGVPHRLMIYEGAPHGFFSRDQPEFREASEDAWKRLLEFVGTGGAVVDHRK